MRIFSTISFTFLILNKSFGQKTAKIYLDKTD